MTKILDVKTEIEDLEITMDEAITMQVLNSLDSSFARFLGILSHKAREKIVFSFILLDKIFYLIENNIS